ncbi:MAG: ABC transporter ATP-binding protein [Crocinitomicaceae bacterium]|jgi:ABC-type multidrug transport system fused ATPase/permease subunit|nr:ABC transporter ATP-binding protein [Crocinitomicaceae bacterium]MBK6951189.1 ABC transporter ATP-binding protein [Crocinitomicaceae bacterium]MBK9590603.1 ABC transporter ATP-binding protein [Crocinitomicaceae bacterium]
MSKKKVSLKQVFKDIMWPRRKILFGGLILILISRTAGFVLPMSLQVLIDDAVKNSNIELMKYLLIAVIIALSIQAITSFWLTKLLSVEAQHLISQLRVQVQKKILTLPISYFDNNKSGALVSRIMTDVEGVRNLVGTGFVQLIGGSLTAIAALVLLIKINWIMTLSTLIPIAVFAYIAMRAFGKIRPIFKERGKLNADVTGRLTETISGVRVIKGFNAEEQENKIFERGADQLFQNVKSSLTATSMVTSLATFLLGVGSVCIMGIGGYLMMNGEMEAGEFISFTVLLGFMVAPIVQMSNIGSQMTEAFAGLDRTAEIMNSLPENDDSVRTIKLEKIKGDIKFDKVSFAYEQGKEVLHEVSFDAPLGSVTALVGTSGSGKSTIAGLAATFLQPQSGMITIDGQDLSKVNLSSYRQFLGVVLQDDFLFEGTIRENIMFPRPNATEEQLQHAVKAAYVNEFTDRFEEGLNTVIGERGVKLSGGQRQRLAIARAILADPSIIILDEATSSLDTESESLIQKSLGELMKGRTTFVIAHRLSTIRQANQILVIEAGKIAEQGTHDELIAKQGRYYNLYTYQSRI